MKNKFIILSIVAILMFAFTGCQDNKKEVSKNKEAIKIEKINDINDKNKNEENIDKIQENKEDEEAINEENKETGSENKEEAINEETNDTSLENKEEVINENFVAPKVNNSNIFISDQPIFNENAVNLNPSNVYYNGDSLVVEAYVTNGLNSTIFNINLDEFTLANNSGVIASAAFGNITDLVINPHQAIKWTFIFNGNDLKIKNADLSYLEWKSKTRYNY